MRYVILLALGICLLSGTPAVACFGPKLFVATDGGARQQLLSAVVTIFLKEKTGIESNLVTIPPGGGQQALQEDRVDLVFSPDEIVGATLVFKVEALSSLFSGPRPLEELQFSLVVPALKKLQGLLQPEQVRRLIGRVESGAPPLATARRFLQKQGWI